MMRMAWVVLVLSVAGCGSAEHASKEHVDPDTTGRATVGSCAVDSPQVRSARRIASVDLDGDGDGDQVRLTAQGGECGNTLFAELPDGVVSTALAAGTPPVTSGFAVAPAGADRQLLVTRADHPRGGYQLRVYAATPDQLTELKSDGKTLFPFVATDVDEHPASIDCSEEGIVVTEAVPHEPVGVVAAWDVERTTYAVADGKVTAGPTEEVADNVLPHQLEAKYPELVRHAAFPSCRDRA
jgi:hypothetical protein